MLAGSSRTRHSSNRGEWPYFNSHGSSWLKGNGESCWIWKWSEQAMEAIWTSEFENSRDEPGCRHAVPGGTADTELSVTGVEWVSDGVGGGGVVTHVYTAQKPEFWDEQVLCFLCSLLMKYINIIYPVPCLKGQTSRTCYTLECLE